MSDRKAQIIRKTKETEIEIELNLDGTGDYSIQTGIAFLDHMLDLFSKHSLIDLQVTAKGDLEVDDHHTVEDIGLVMGEALNKALGQRAGITRYGWCLLPMDETLSRIAIDLGGRPFLVFEMATRARKIKTFELSLIHEFFRAFCDQGRFNLHVKQLYGRDPHHAYESVFKGVARAIGMACSIDSRVAGIPSSKGVL